MTARVRPYLLATAAVAAVFLVRWLLAPVLGSSLPFITFFFAVFFAAWYGGFGPAIYAAVLSGLLAAAVFFPVPGGVDLSTASGQVGLALFGLSGLAVGAMGRARINAQRTAAEAARTANEAASEARAARSKTEAILAGISDGFMLLSRDWKILYLNSAALKLSGRSAAELIGRDHWEVFPESRGTLFESAYRRALERMEVVRVEEYHPPIERWLSVTAYPSADGLSVFAQDVTEQRQAEQLAQDTAAAELFAEAAASQSPRVDRGGCGLGPLGNAPRHLGRVVAADSAAALLGIREQMVVAIRGGEARLEVPAEHLDPYKPSVGTWVGASWSVFGIVFSLSA